jgi:hypothetical protein
LQIPEFESLIIRTGESLPISTNGNDNPILPTKAIAQRPQELPGLQIPNLDGSIETAADKPLTIGTYGKRFYRIGMSR